MQLVDINPELFNVFQVAVVDDIFLVLAQMRDHLRNPLVCAVIHSAVLVSTRPGWNSESHSASGAIYSRAS